MNRTRSASLATRQVTITPRWLVDAAGFDPATCSLQGRIASLVHERPERAACTACSLIMPSSLFLLLKRAPGRFGGRPCGAGRGYLPLGASWTAGRARPWTTCPAQGARGARGSGNGLQFGNHVLTYGISLWLSLCRFVCKSGTQLLRTGPCAATRPPGQPWQSWPARRAEKTTAAGDREHERSRIRCCFLLALRLRFVRLSRARQQRGSASTAVSAATLHSQVLGLAVPVAPTASGAAGRRSNAERRVLSASTLAS